jgi:hypothetical protein
MSMIGLEFPPGLGKFTILLMMESSTNHFCSSWYVDSTDIRFFHSGSGEVTFSNVTIHEGLAEAWPERKR